MGVYSKINENIGDMLKSMCANENIQKLLISSLETALTDSLPVGFPVEGLDLLNYRIFDIPKSPDPETDTGAYIVAYFNDASFAGENNLNQYNMVVDVLVINHKNSWNLLYGKKRPLELLDEIDNIIRNTKTSSIRGNWQPYSPAKFIRVNDSFEGYVTKWIVTNFSKECVVS